MNSTEYLYNLAFTSFRCTSRNYFPTQICIFADMAVDLSYFFFQIINIMDILRAPNINDMKDVYPLKTLW